MIIGSDCEQFLNQYLSFLVGSGGTIDIMVLRLSLNVRLLGSLVLLGRPVCVGLDIIGLFYPEMAPRGCIELSGGPRNVRWVGSEQITTFCHYTICTECYMETKLSTTNLCLYISSPHFLFKVYFKHPPSICSWGHVAHSICPTVKEGEKISTALSRPSEDIDIFC